MMLHVSEEVSIPLKEIIAIVPGQAENAGRGSRILLADGRCVFVPVLSAALKRRLKATPFKTSIHR